MNKVNDEINLDRMPDGYHVIAEGPCIIRTSPFTGTRNAYSFGIDADTFGKALSEWQSGELIQNAFPMLDADEREFIMTGITPEEWPA